MKKFSFVIPEELHTRMKVYCAEKGISIVSFIIALIERALKNEN